MEIFYEIRRQLQNPNQWTHEAYFQNRKDAELYTEYRKKWMKERMPTSVNINFEIDKHKFNKLPSGLGAKNR